MDLKKYDIPLLPTHIQQTMAVQRASVDQEKNITACELGIQLALHRISQRPHVGT